MKIVWTEPAQENLREIHKSTSCRHDEAAANALVDRIIVRAAQLADFPESGHRFDPDKYPDCRQVILRPYRIIYRVRDSAVEVLNVFHGARQHL